jgi:hypothetical protein
MLWVTLLAAAAVAPPVPPVPAPPAPAGAAEIVSGTGARLVSLTPARAPRDSTLVLPLAASLQPGTLTSAPRSSAAVPVATPASVSLSGDVRMRLEDRTLFDYRLPGTFARPSSEVLGERGDVALTRARISAESRPAPFVQVRASARQSHASGRPGIVGQESDDLALEEAWAELDSLRGFSLRAGRQSLGYADGRVLASGAWSNALPAFDGARLRWALRSLRLEGFAAWLAAPHVIERDRLLEGLDAALSPRRAWQAEAWHVARRDRDPAWTSELGTAGGRFDATSGWRTRARAGRLELQVMSERQRGRRAGEPVEASRASAVLALELHSLWRTRLLVSAMDASGDADPADGRFGRFDPVSFGEHGFQGALDLASASNVIDRRAGIAFEPAPGWTFTTDLHTLALASPTDAWVDGAGAPVRRDPTGGSGTDLGREVDTTVRWRGRSRFAALAGASRFDPGAYVKATGGGAPVAWAFVQLEAVF